MNALPNEEENMVNRVDAQALCRCLYELTDGDHSASLEIESAGAHLAFTAQEAQRAASHAERRGWLAVDGTKLRLTTEGRRLAQLPWRQRFRIWGESAPKPSADRVGQDLS